MPLEAIFTLVAKADCKIPPFVGDQTRAAFMEEILKKNEKLATLLHDYPRLKPYAVKPLAPTQGGKKIKGGYWIVRRGDELRASFSVLMDQIVSEIKEILLEIERLKICGFEFAVESDPVFREVPYSRFRSRDVRKFRIRFLTPVAFKGMDEKFSTPFPEPSRVFKSLSNIWAKFADEKPIPPDSIMPVMYEVKTREVSLMGLKITGCKGFVDYVVIGDSNDAYKLLKLAEFSNIGYKRTAGLGVVEVKFLG